MSSQAALGGDTIEQLRAAVGGEVVTPEHPDYEEARRVWNGMVDCRPALIVRCSSTQDVAAAVNFGRDNGLVVSVRGGSHSTPGYSTCDDGIVIDLGPMHEVKVDPEARTARVGGGATWGQMDAATQEHGLAVTGGRVSDTGVGGLATGSGSGWLERMYGVTAGSLLSAEVVTADGSVVRASADENPELFWGLRGGGGNFGVVTSFTYRLHPVGPIILGGLLVSLPERAEDILRFHAEYWPSAPDDLGGGVAFISAPPEPFVPAEMHFKPVVGHVICWTGDPEEGERVLAPIREVAQPVMDMVQPMPYVALQSMLDAGGPKGINGYMKAEFMEVLDEEAIGKLARHGAARVSPMSQIIMEPLGGAVARVGEDDTALGRRDVEWVYHALAMWMEPDAASAEANMTWAKTLSEDLRPHVTEGVYLNYTSDQGEERVRSTYGPAKYERLVALKDRYDPDNLFRLNQNIRPSGAAATA
jgi:FAD binding domain-containing protein/berberine-like enzyme